MNQRGLRSQALVDAATCGILRGFLAVRGSAVRCGVDLATLLAAERILVSRQHATLSFLEQELGIMCGAFEKLSSESMEALVLVLDSARFVLQRAAARHKSPAEAPPYKERVMHLWRTFLIDLYSLTRRGGPPFAELSLVSLHPSPSHSLPTYSTPDVSKPRGLFTRGVKRDGERTYPSDSQGVGALAPIWPSLKSAVQLGLSDAAFLALCVFGLHRCTHLAEADGKRLSVHDHLSHWSRTGQRHVLLTSYQKHALVTGGIEIRRACTDVIKVPLGKWNLVEVPWEHRKGRIDYHGDASQPFGRIMLQIPHSNVLPPRTESTLMCISILAM
ncbi:hypothetical protein VOLCADRAFT_95278 [Volvox carteri f. nagariensis]|uniref:Uncharacterized protein n=1 Tax=Volvox carteri f. nagariensis TaxID=3068 RepID=D8U728_VOLCA|nr:uncharacterized protein VOLCADRAFT_95278 [Volvox carteri f. nagariensis]EFJ44356.1 hypothetical protein VOLCADRAFT_95278 [Volvox carteri f. nagariensis]|eukprot:XP_002954463.1 hypothetical protein VOLCADRAFT_95278 [Volvox carteri f. nagariensis]